VWVIRITSDQECFDVPWMIAVNPETKNYFTRIIQQAGATKAKAIDAPNILAKCQ